MQKLRPAECFGMQAASLLELERGLTGDGKRWPAADCDHADRADKRVYEAAPIKLSCSGQPIRQPLDSAAESYVIGPGCGQAQKCGECCNERLARRNAEFGPSPYRQDNVAR